MKKLICCCLVIIFSLSVIGCCAYYDYDEMKEEIAVVEIIKFQPYEGNLYPDKDKEYDLILRLTQEEKDELLLELSKIKFTRVGPPNSSPKGLCLKLYYHDESYGFINHNSHLRFNKDGTNYISSIGVKSQEDDFIKLFSMFIEIGYYQL